MSNPAASRLADARSIATEFVAARRAARSLASFPGTLPADLHAAYWSQDIAIDLWPAPVVGWKVGYVSPDRRDADGDERLVGPIFADRLQHADGDVAEFPVIVGGFAAVEAEFVFRIARDASADKRAWTVDEAAALVADMHIGIEFAGSPLATINELGPVVVVSDFGNNAGLLLGPVVPNWYDQSPYTLTCITRIDGRIVGRGDAANLEGGPLAALAFALGRNARRGRPLRAGDLVTTGAVTGIHEICAGQSASVDFAFHGELHCFAVPARPRQDESC